MDNSLMRSERQREIAWSKAARKAFDGFPIDVRSEVIEALAYVAAGGFPSKAKPLKGAGAGLFELALRFRTDAYRTIYAIEFAGAVWVLHGFQKKSKSGIETPRHEIDTAVQRLKRLREETRNG